MQFREMCQILEQLVATGNFKEATKLRYEVLDWKETLGGMEEMDEFLKVMGDKIMEQRKKEREQRKTGSKV